MVDCQFYGLHAGGHHSTNVLLHAATAILLFLVLRRMTGGVWPSALVAALFAVHPLRVESVAWVSERKDVLSGLLFVLTLGAYVRYVRGPFSLGRYLLVAALLTLGLMAKPMLVTLPLVLLLLDYWPLGRMTAVAREDISVASGGRADHFFFPKRLLLEKLPLLLLAAAFCVVTLYAQGEVVVLKERLPISSRLTNALVSYVAYLRQLFYPVALAVFYPHPEGGLPIWKVIGALAVLACISVGVLACWRRHPYLLVGWLWYVGMLAPVIGLMQAGAQAMADRYTYLPQIGLCIALVWAVADVCRSWPYRRWLCGVTSALVLAVLMGCAWRQTSFWRDSETLWTHTIACTSPNCVAQNNLGLVLVRKDRAAEGMAHYRQALAINADYTEARNNLANALAGQGRFDEALAHYFKSLEIQPNSAEARYNLGNLLARCERYDEAVVQYRRALAIHDYAEAHNNLGSLLSRLGRFDEALAEYRKALEIKPDDAEAHVNLGNALVGRGQTDEALTHYRQALDIKPAFADAHDGLGVALSCLGRHSEALAQYRQALEIKPDDAEAHNNLAWLRATCPLASLRNGAEAIEHAQRADRLCGGQRSDVLDSLAAAYAEAGWFPEALAVARKALDLAVRQNKQALASGLRARIARYEAGKPYREMATTSTDAVPHP